VPGLLPEQFRFSHEFAFFLHDILASVVVVGERAGIFNTRVHFDSSSDIEAFSRLSGDELWNWLQENGYEEAIFEIAYKQSIVALLSDLGHFVYEALSCSEKGKLTVAYSLLRKPFKENLFYFEWLLADPEDFKQKFHEEGTDTLVLVGRQSVPRERRLEIIQEAVAKTRFPDWVSAQFLYDLRYSRDADYGFDRLWNQATHLITTFRAFRTEDENFNFVFSTRGAHLDQWRHIYSLVPLLLYHTVEVIEALIATITDLDSLEIDWDYTRRVAGFGLWVRDFYSDERNGLLQSLLNNWNNLNLKCPKCGRTVNFDEVSLERLYKLGEVKCRACRKRFKLNQATR
jgi:hypothetical protein